MSPAGSSADAVLSYSSGNQRTSGIRILRTELVLGMELDTCYPTRATVEEESKAFADILGDLLDFARRRVFYLLIPFLVVGTASSVIAMKLPAIYRSKGTILIEEQQIPKNLVPTTVTDFADQRIHVIKQRIMTRDRILGIIDRYHLYTQEQRLMPSELVEKFKQDAQVELMSADVKGGGKATIAFTISFDHKEPDRAQTVANELVSLFLAENTRVRTEQASRTTEFLNEETERMKQEIQRLETLIAAYKENFGRSLPEFLPSNLSAIDRNTTDFRQTESQINVLKERIAYLTAELPRVRHEAPAPRDEKGPVSKEEQLRQLKAEYLRLASRYNPSHPDVLRVQRQIRVFEPNFVGTVAEQGLANDLETAQQQLAAVKEKYSDNHPDVAKLKDKVKILQSRLGSSRSHSKKVVEPSDESHDPMYINLLSQLKSSQAELGNLLKQREELRKAMEELHGIVDKTPQVERRYQELVRERQSTVEKFVELKAKAQEAQLAQTLEEEHKGETFILSDPPVVPDFPEKPNRSKIAFMGLMLGIVSGVGTAFLAESIEGSVRGHKALEQIIGMPPVVVIPYIETQSDVELRRRKVKRLLIGMALLFVLASLAVHLFVMPLPQIWARAMGHLQRL